MADRSGGGRIGGYHHCIRRSVRPNILTSSLMRMIAAHVYADKIVTNGVELQDRVMAYLLVAEDALLSDVGQKCWGCQDFYPADCNHKRLDCSRKDEEVCHTTALTYIYAFCARTRDSSASLLVSTGDYSSEDVARFAGPWATPPPAPLSAPPSPDPSWSRLKTSGGALAGRRTPIARTLRTVPRCQ